MTEIERRERIVQGAADEKLHGQVVNAAGLVLAVFSLRLDPTPCQLVTRYVGKGTVKLFGICRDGLGCKCFKQLAVDFGTKGSAMDGGSIGIKHLVGTPVGW